MFRWFCVRLFFIWCYASISRCFFFKFNDILLENNFLKCVQFIFQFGESSFVHESVQQLDIKSYILMSIILAHLNRASKLDFLITICPSSVHLFVRLSVNIFYLFSRTTGANLTELGTNDPYGKGILNY